MCKGRNPYACLRDTLYFTSKISFPLALLLITIVVLLAWVGFAVPDWLSYTSVLSAHTKFGLWNICIQSYTFFSSGYSCKSWSSSGYTLPDFLKSVQGFITIGCLFATFSLAFGVAAIFLKRGIFRFFSIFAGICAFIAFLFFVLGVGVFSGDSDDYVESLAGSFYKKRWGYWIFYPTLFLALLAALLFPFNFVYKNYIANRLFNFIDNKQMLNSNLPSKMPAAFGMTPAYPPPNMPRRGNTVVYTSTDTLSGFPPQTTVPIPRQMPLPMSAHGPPIPGGSVKVTTYESYPAGGRSGQFVVPGMTSTTKKQQHKSILKNNHHNNNNKNSKLRPYEIPMREILETNDEMNIESDLAINGRECVNNHHHHNRYQEQQETRYVGDACASSTPTGHQEKYIDTVLKKPEESKWVWERIKSFKRTKK